MDDFLEPKKKIVKKLRPRKVAEESVEEDIVEEDIIEESEIEESTTIPEEDVIIKETVKTDVGEEHTLKITPSANTEAVVVDTGTKFSDLSDHSVSFTDFYQDSRTFLAKANSTKFILISFLMLSIPALLIYGLISETVYREMVILLAISYLGVDVYEKKSLIKK